jgi:hypothetical protein
MQTYSLSLAAFANQEIQIGFRARDGLRQNFTSDLHLTDVEITSTLAFDLGATSIIFPAQAMERDSSYNVSVRVANYGTAEATNVPVVLVLDGYNQTRVVPSILPGQNVLVNTFPPFTPSNGGNFTGYAHSSLSSDQNIGNDTVYQSYTIIGRVSVKPKGDLGGMKVFPNPTSDLIDVVLPQQLSAGQIMVNLFNVQGQELNLRQEPQMVEGNRIRLSVKHISQPGVYFLKISNDQGSSFISFVKE